MENYMNRDILLNILRNEAADKNFLFHYTNFKTGLECILNKLELKFGLMKNLDDPFETNDKFFKLNDKSNIFKDKEFNKLIKNYTKIACFSIDTKQKKNLIPLLNKGYLRSRMWSHYADRHKGFCFILDKEKLLRTINEKFNKNDFLILNNNVKYSDSYKKSTFTKNNLTDFFPKNIIKKYKNELFFSKISDFNNENEFRICIIDFKLNDQNDLLINIRDSILGVIISKQFNEVYLPSLKELINKNNVHLFELDWGEYIPSLL